MQVWLKKKGPAQQLFIQVNTGEEPQKAGIFPEQLDSFIKECRSMDLPIEGLMCIPPIDEEPSLHFSLLKKLQERNDVNSLINGNEFRF